MSPLALLAEFLRPRRCPHTRDRCVHGDEVNARGGARRACLDCGRSLPGPLPATCAATGCGSGYGAHCSEHGVVAVFDDPTYAALTAIGHATAHHGRGPRWA